MSTELNPVQQAQFPASAPVSAASMTMEANEFTRLNARDIFNIFLRHNRTIGLVVVAVTIMVMLLILFEGPSYTARAITKIDMLPSLGTTGVTPQEREMRMETQKQLVASQSLGEVVVRNLKLDKNAQFMGSSAPKKMTSAQESQRVSVAAEKLHEAIEVKRQPQTQLLEVDVTTRAPQLSADIADQFAIALQQWDNQSRASRRRHSLEILLPQLKRAEQDAYSADRAVADARRKYQLLPGAGTELDLSQINGITNEMVSAAGQSAGSSARASGVAGSNIGGVSLAAQATADLASKQHQYDDLVRRQAELSVTYGNNYPELKAVNAQVASLRSQIASQSEQERTAAIGAVAANARRDSDLARSDASGASARSSTLKGYLNHFVGQAYANTENNVEVSRLDRDAKAKKDAALALESQFEQVVNNSSAGGIIATVLSPAAVPATSSTLSWTKALIASLIGSFVLGCLFAFGREMTDNRLRSSNQVRRRFGLRTFGMLPRVDRDVLAAPSDNPVMRQPRSIFAETARSLYTDVVRLAGGRSQVVTVTSGLPGEGKSTVALTLAAAASMMGRRTILVDLDLRRYGMLQDLHRETGGPDLIDFLAKRRPVSDLNASFPVQGNIYREESPASKLPAILSACGPVVDPGALIASPELSRLVQELREQFDFVVINAPPLLAVRDAKVLSRMADDTLLVIKWGKTIIEEMEAAIDTLDRPPAGVVFNDVDYAEHARRRYSDPIQFIARATDYYDDAGGVAHEGTMAQILRSPFSRFWGWIAAVSPSRRHSTTTQPLAS
jgi:succinoglycan biosynthesis transport protein ExoP